MCITQVYRIIKGKNHENDGVFEGLTAETEYTITIRRIKDKKQEHLRLKPRKICHGQDRIKSLSLRGFFLFLSLEKGKEISYYISIKKKG